VGSFLPCSVRLEQEIQNARESLRVAFLYKYTIREKFVAMGHLAAGMEHKLNTPLGNILGYARMLERSVAETPKLAGYAHIITEEIQRCSRVVLNPTQAAFESLRLAYNSGAVAADQSPTQSSGVARSRNRCSSCRGLRLWN
jgi:signal transduction histidine kinase